jgi:hypothetical protein
MKLTADTVDVNLGPWQFYSGAGIGYRYRVGGTEDSGGIDDLIISADISAHDPHTYNPRSRKELPLILNLKFKEYWARLNDPGQGVQVLDTLKANIEKLQQALRAVDLDRMRTNIARKIQDSKQPRN